MKIIDSELTNPRWLPKTLERKKKSKFCPLLFHNAIEFYSTFKYFKKNCRLYNLNC